MKKRFLSILLSVMMILSLMPAVVFATDFNTDWTALTADGGALDSGKKYYLAGDVTLTNNLTVSGEVTLDLNGHVLTGNGSGCVITVNAGGALTLQDSNADAVHKFTPDENGLWALDETGGAKTVTGGVITGGTGTQVEEAFYGGGVYVSGTFTMSGGNIVGNTAGSGGGGMRVASGGKFTMNNGNIVGNKAEKSGGGVEVAGGGTFIMNNGDIVGNTAVNSYGGGVCLSQKEASFEMVNGKIADNIAGQSGGGVYVGGGKFAMTDGTVAANSAKENYGGGVCIGSGAFTMSGGAITGNTAKMSGGGVGYLSGTVTLGGVAQITGNTAGTEGSKAENNLYLNKEKTVTIAEAPNAPTTSGAAIMSVGVTTMTAPAEGSPVAITGGSGTAKYARYFSSDNPAYAVVAAGSESVKLVAVGDNAAVNVDKGSLYGNLTAALSEASEDDTIRLLKDVKEDVTIGSGQVIVLDLNGHVLKGNGNGSVIMVENGATLNLYDCDNTTEHYFTEDATTGLWALAEDQTKPTDHVITGGVITGGTGTMDNDLAYGGCVYVSGGAFTMNGGTIIGNAANFDGGGVYVDNGTFTMNGGTICNNIVDFYGAGVFVNKGKFTMNGGTICNNIGYYGAGVYVSVDGIFTMNNGTISENAANFDGGGVYVSGGTVNMKGGSINQNTAETNGGGVYAGRDLSYDYMNDITLGGTSNIIGNTVNGKANNLYLSAFNEVQRTVTLGDGSDVPASTTSGAAIMSVGVTTEIAPTNDTPVAITKNGASTDAGYFTSDNNAYEVKFNTNHLELAVKTAHVHDFTYKANGGKLTATCTDGCTVGYGASPLTLTLTAPASLVYDGNAKCFNFADGEAEAWTAAQLELPTIYYYVKQSGQSEYMPLLGPLNAIGNYMARITVSGEEAQIKFSITEAPPVPSSSGDINPTITVPVNGDANSVKVQATVSGSTATVKDIKAEDLAKVSGGESVEIDLSGAGKNVDTAKLPTATVEKIAAGNAMSVKLPAATVEFDKTATAEIAEQAKGSNIELVVDDIKEVSLNAVQKEAVKKLDTAIILDAYLESNGSRLCTEESGGFGGGSAKVILPYEIKNNRTPENYSVFYVAEDGKLQKLNAVYDKELKAFVFEISHFSVYAVAYDEYVNPFSDVAETAYYYEAVKWAASSGVTSGKTSSTFAPNDTCTRAEFVTFLWRAAGKPVVNYAMPFTDVAADKYYTEAVRWAASEGIVMGTTETTFSPNALVNRGQAVAFLYRYSKAPALMNMTANGPAPSPFSDVANTSYCYQAVLWAVKQGITEGVTDTTFAPTANCPRAQVVSFLYRYFVK